MDEARLFTGFPVSEQPVEAGEPISMYGAGVAVEMIDGVFPLAIHAELIPRARRGLTAPWPFITDIAPQTRGLRLLELGLGLQLDRRVIREQCGAISDQCTDVAGQGFPGAFVCRCSR